MENSQEKSDKEETPAATEPSMAASIAQNGWKLGAFALACTLFIAATQFQTADRIADQQRKAQLRALLEIVPASKHDNDMLSDSIDFFDEKLGLRESKQLYFAKRNEQTHTIIYPAIARDGYSGDISYIVGVRTDDASIAGVRVLEHKETPGLGDGIELRKSDWILNFDGKSLNNPSKNKWTVKKEGGEFDGFTGATITPRALTRSIAGVLEYHKQHMKTLLAKASAAGQQKQ